MVKLQQCCTISSLKTCHSNRNLAHVRIVSWIAWSQFLSKCLFLTNLYFAVLRNRFYFQAIANQSPLLYRTACMQNWRLGPVPGGEAPPCRLFLLNRAAFSWLAVFSSPKLRSKVRDISRAASVSAHYLLLVGDSECRLRAVPLRKRWRHRW